jgi:2'-5' RNA ligase
MKKLLEIIKENLEGDHKLSSTQIYLPNFLAEEILKFTLSIPQEDLYTEEEGYGRELEVHTTILYGLTSDSPDEVKNLIKEYDGKYINGKLGEVSLFEGKDKPYDVVKIDVESEDLNTLHELLKTLDNEDTYPEYQSHCTIAYVKKGMGKKYIGKKNFTGKIFSVDKLYFCSANGDKYRIDLVNE